MRKYYTILKFLIFLLVCSSCARKNVKIQYINAHAFYLKGELTQAVNSYISCISFIRTYDNEIAAYSYQDMASICYLEGNYKIAYEINTRSAEYFDRAGLAQKHSDALCRSAVYNAYLGNNEEAITQLLHIKALSPDTMIKIQADNYIQILRSNQLPDLKEAQLSFNPSELYEAVQLLKYELYRKPHLIKMIFFVVCFTLAIFGIYAIHSGFLNNLHDLRREKKRYYQQYTNNIEDYCVFLRTHPEELKKELHWRDYSIMCSIVNVKLGHLAERLSKYETLNETEIRLCILVFIGLQRNMIAEILPYASNSVGKLKNTVSKKAGYGRKKYEKCTT